MIVKLLIEQHLEFLNLKGGCTGSSESTLVKMSHCWKSQDSSIKSSVDTKEAETVTISTMRELAERSLIGTYLYS